MSPHTLRRTGAAALAGLLAAGLGLAGPSARAATDPAPAAKGAIWLQGRLHADGLLHAAYDGGSGPVDYVDYGGTIEAAYALDAVGRTGKLAAITAGLQSSVDSYVTGVDYGEPGDLAAGPTGKLLAFVTDLGGDASPTDFGGTDLVARMESLTTDSGRIADTDVAPYYCGSSYDQPCDYANVYGQTWATRGLLNVGSPEAGAALGFLLDQQCADGHFPSFFGDACDATSTGPDATAFAVILLHDKAAGDPTLATALDDAAAWLRSAQAGNGSFADDNGHANADSTGLAAWALRELGADRAARKAAVWLRALQVPGRSCDGALDDQRGAVAYDRSAYADGRADGITQLSGGQWQTVAVQSLPALSFAPSTLEPLQVYVARRVDAGGTARVRVLGLAPGERGCVGFGDKLQPVVGAADGDSVAVDVHVPRQTGTLRVKALSATDSVTARTLSR